MTKADDMSRGPRRTSDIQPLELVPGDMLTPIGFPDYIACYSALEGTPFELKYDHLIDLDKTSLIIVVAVIDYIFQNIDHDTAPACLVLLPNYKFAWMFATSVLSVMKKVSP